MSCTGAAILLAVAVCSLPGVAGAGFNPLRAYWKQQEVSIVVYGQAMADYSCVGLERKFLGLLDAVGVRADRRVVAEGCLSGVSPEAVQRTIVHVRMRFHALLPERKGKVPTTAVVESDTAEQPAVEFFPVERVYTRLAWNDRYEVEVSDCLLLQRFMERVMVYIPHQVVDDPQCRPEAPAGPQLRVLVPGR